MIEITGTLKEAQMKTLKLKPTEKLARHVDK